MGARGCRTDICGRRCSGAHGHPSLACRRGKVDAQESPARVRNCHEGGGRPAREANLHDGDGAEDPRTHLRAQESEKFALSVCKKTKLVKILKWNLQVMSLGPFQNYPDGQERRAA